MTKLNLKGLRRPVISSRCDSLIEASAAFIGSFLFMICGLFMILWGNLSGDVWPIPEDLAPFWLRLLVGAIIIIISVYFLRLGKDALRKQKRGA